MREAVATGATVEEARDKAVLMLGDIGDADIEIEVIDMPKKKTLGIFGGNPAKVRAYAPSLDNEKQKKQNKKPAAQKNSAPQEKKEHKAYETKNNVKSEKRADNKTENKADNKANNAEKPAKQDKSAKSSAEEKKNDAPVTYGVKNAESTVKYVSDMLEKMDIGEFTVSTTDIENGIRLDIEGDGMGTVIGRRGETLDALQYLASLHCNHGEEGDFRRVVLDTSGYRDKREKTLQALAAKMARQALRTGRNQSLEPMNPYERRIIHTAVQEIDGVTSWSISDGKNRRVVIGFEKGSEPAPRPRSGGRGGRRSGYSNAKKEQPSAPAAETKKETGEGPIYGRIG